MCELTQDGLQVPETDQGVWPRMRGVEQNHLMREGAVRKRPSFGMCVMCFKLTY